MTSVGGTDPADRDPSDSVVADLLAWRDRLVQEKRIPEGAMKDTFLRSAVLRGNRDERVVEKLLPSSLAHLASEIVARIKTVESAQQQSPPAAGPPGAAEPETTPASAIPVPSVAAPGAVSPPGPATSGSDPTDDEDISERARRFAPYAFESADTSVAPIGLRWDDGEVGLEWPDVAGSDAYGVFRVVSGDEEDAPAGPEFGELLTITQDREAYDVRPFTAAVRHFQVWYNAGRDEANAYRRQPRLHAAGQVVAPVQEPRVSAAPGRVTGQWQVFPETVRVHVFRIPAEKAASARLNAEYEILADEANLSGFVDTGAIGGKRYVYRFVVEVAGTNQQSPTVVRTVVVPTSVTGVGDLDAVGHGDAEQWTFDLSWTDPQAGTVRIYRTDKPRPTAIEKETLSESSLDQNGFSASQLIDHPADRSADGRRRMKQVLVAADLHRVYFTPVTVLEGKARVGTTISRAMIPPPEDAVIVERTAHQLLRFSWPGDAAAVAIRVGPLTDQAVVPEPGPGYAEVSREVYDRLGCHQFQSTLGDGVTVHLAGLSFVDRERVLGEPVAVSYRGLLRLRYTLEVKRSLLRAPDRMLIRLAADRPLSNCPPFVVVHHPDRLPLHVHDGRPLEATLDVDDVRPSAAQFRPQQLGTTLSDPAFRVSVRGLSGFVRVFADVSPDVLATVAVLDPPMASLVLGG